MKDPVGLSQYLACIQPNRTDGSAFGWGTLLEIVTGAFQSHYGSVMDSAPNRSEYRNLPGGGEEPKHKFDNLAAICEPVV
jgi:hypothetical protein